MATKPANAKLRAEHLGPARRRPMVLDVALKIFVEQGSAGVSMDAIAEAAGVTKPVIYACFPGRAELLQALLDREEKRLLGHLTAALPEQPTLDDPEGGLRAGYTAFLSAVLSAPDSWRLILLSERADDEHLRERILRGRAIQTERVARLVTAQYTTRGVPDAERKGELLARTIIAAGQSAAALMLEDPDRWEPQELAKMLARIVVRGAARL
jgi:AcrR family transcriptional regulator